MVSTVSCSLSLCLCFEFKLAVSLEVLEYLTEMTLKLSLEGSVGYGLAEGILEVMVVVA